MTDDNLTEEAYQRRLHARISEWSQNTRRVPQADPFTPLTPVNEAYPPLPSTGHPKTSLPRSLNGRRRPPPRETSTAPQTGIYGDRRPGPPPHPHLFVDPHTGCRSQAPRPPLWGDHSVAQAPQMQFVGPNFQGQNGYVYPGLPPPVYRPVVYHPPPGSIREQSPYARRTEFSPPGPIREQSPYPHHARSTMCYFLKRLLGCVGWFRRRSRGTTEGVTRRAPGQWH
ncbi:hypothetical protein B0H11DRAFT_2113204 [Mycena galericulata]|nr:hypothetical protein B0H11DRAFT_2113204 [Mycena galericulata]